MGVGPKTFQLVAAHGKGPTVETCDAEIKTQLGPIIFCKKGVRENRTIAVTSNHQPFQVSFKFIFIRLSAKIQIFPFVWVYLMFQ